MRALLCSVMGASVFYHPMCVAFSCGLRWLTTTSTYWPVGRKKGGREEDLARPKSCIYHYHLLTEVSHSATLAAWKPGNVYLYFGWSYTQLSIPVKGK